MADPDLAAPQALDLGVVEMNAVGKPNVWPQPADLLEIVDRPTVEVAFAIGNLVTRLGEMRMKPASVSTRECSGLHHQFLCRGERSAGSERDLDHRPVASLVVGSGR